MDGLNSGVEGQRKEVVNLKIKKQELLHLNNRGNGI